MTVFRKLNNPCKCTFPKKIEKYVGAGGQHFQHVMLQGTQLFFFVILLNYKPLSICWPGSDLSAVAIVSRRVARNT